MLTRNTKNLLLYIYDYTKKELISPSYEEMRIHMGKKSKSGIWRLMKSLKKHGYISYTPKKMRTVIILKMPYGFKEI